MGPVKLLLDNSHEDHLIRMVTQVLLEISLSIHPVNVIALGDLGHCTRSMLFSDIIALVYLSQRDLPAAPVAGFQGKAKISNAAARPFLDYIFCRFWLDGYAGSDLPLLDCDAYICLDTCIYFAYSCGSGLGFDFLVVSPSRLWTTDNKMGGERKMIFSELSGISFRLG